MTTISVNLTIDFNGRTYKTYLTVMGSSQILSQDTLNAVEAAAKLVDASIPGADLPRLLQHHRLHLSFSDSAGNNISQEISPTFAYTDVPDIAILDRCLKTKRLDEEGVAIVRKLEEFSNKGFRVNHFGLSRSASRDSMDLFNKSRELETILEQRDQILREFDSLLPTRRRVDSRLLMERLLTDFCISHDEDDGGCGTAAGGMVTAEGKPAYRNLLFHILRSAPHVCPSPASAVFRTAFTQAGLTSVNLLTHYYSLNDGLHYPGSNLPFPPGGRALVVYNSPLCRGLGQVARRNGVPVVVVAEAGGVVVKTQML
ncbi:hypothetical protein HK104_001894 [Borealophlyctis nickersoniae]|nr:hypothetical protein HK104_001894 [Borealophlyctis nickersoniae]